MASRLESTNYARKTSRIRVSFIRSKSSLKPTGGVRLSVLACSDLISCSSDSLFSQQFYLLLYTIGNFGFGIDEHIDLGIKYDTSTGIFGMDFYVVLARAGKRVSKRRAKTNRFGKFQRVTADDAKLWFIEKLGGTILN